MTTRFLDEAIEAEEMPIFEETLKVVDISRFVWDTRVPAVTDPWPSIEPATVREAMAMVLGTNDVTAHLYSVAAFRQMLELPELQPCPYCGKTSCEDKWCGLRGDTRVLNVIEGEFSG